MYSPSSGSDGFQTPLNRAFHQLDKGKVSWLAPVVVEELCFRAASKTVFDISRHKLVSLIEAEHERGGKSYHRIDEPQFISIVLLVRREFRSALNRRSISRGLREAAGQIKLWQEILKKETVSPHWTVVTRYQHSATGRLEQSTLLSHTLGGDIVPNQVPMARTATCAIYLAVEYCVPLVESASQRLAIALRNWTVDEEAEVVEVLTGVKETAAQFARFGSPKDTINTYHWLDRFIEEASLVPISRFPDLYGCPLPQGERLVFNIWSVLDNTLGLVSDIHSFSRVTPGLLHWREAGVLDRSRDLVAQASRVLSDETTMTFNEINDWYREHKETLFQSSKSCQTLAKTLKKEQQEAAEDAKTHQSYVHAFVAKLPREHLFGKWQWDK